MRRFVIGTAGHVDHGKTTLVRALTGVDTDRLPEEKKRGITIELGFAPLSLSDEVFASVVDVPGHRRLVHTMIAGASGIDLALLVVAADEGVMPQTREHLAACQLLGITRLVVAITKIDRVERDLALMAKEEVAELCASRFEIEAELCSAKTGEGIDALKATLIRALSRVPPRAQAKFAQLSIDRAFSVKGAGAVVTGTLVRGELGVGDKISIVGRRGMHEAAVRGLHVHSQSLDRVAAPSRVAVNVSGVTLEQITRGDVISTDPALAPTSRFDGRLTLLRAVKASAELEVYVGTARSPARLQVLREEEQREDGSVVPALGRVRLSRALSVSGGDRFVLRGGGSRGAHGAVVGGGEVLDARPGALREKKRRRAVLSALIEGDLTASARALVAERAPRALLSSELSGRFAQGAAALGRALSKLADKGEIVRIKDEGFIAREALHALAERARGLVRAHHDKKPLDRGLKLETLRQKLAERAGMSAALEAIRVACKASVEGTPIVVEGDIARLEGFVDGGASVRGGPLDQVAVALADAGLRGLGEHAVGEVAGNAKEARAILAKLSRDGRVLTAGEQWFDKRSIDKLRDQVIAHFRDHAVLTIAEFKALSGLGRKQAIPLLELFDREGVSLRKGDDRAAGPLSKKEPG